MVSVSMKDAALMRDGEAVKVGVVLNAIPAHSCVFIHEDGQSLDYISKNQQLQRLTFDHAATADSMQSFHGDLLQPLAECACQGYCGSLLMCAASVENAGPLLDEVLVKQVAQVRAAQIDLSGGESIHRKGTWDAAKLVEEELRREMEAHLTADRGCLEKVQESIARILKLRDALKQGPSTRDAAAEKCDLCLQLNDEYLFEDHQEQMKELSGSLIREEVEKMERDLAREQLLGTERELLELSTERKILVLQMEALREEARQERRKHQSELRRWREDGLPVFGSFQESRGDQRRVSEAGYKSVLLEAIHDAVKLSAQNQRLRADNNQLRKAVGELKDTLTKQGELKATPKK